MSLGTITRIAAGTMGVFGILTLATLWHSSDGPRPSATTRSPVFTGGPSADVGLYLIERVNRAPDDFVAQNMLAGHLLQRLRETGNPDFLERARRAAEASLISVPAERNAAGLSALARAKIAAHEFAGARVDALRLVQVDPGTLASYGVLADVLLETGDYADADAAIQQMRKLGSDTAETEIRLGRLLFLEGDTVGARRRFFRALAFARHLAVPPRETVAWCRWQMGELEFFDGNYGAAERQYREALAAFPEHAPALASLGRVRAALGDPAGAIVRYEQAVRRLPDPAFVAALGDLYHLAGREQDAETQYALVEQIARLNTANGVRYSRQLALFYADHDREPTKAHLAALHGYAERHDIYGADTLAWAALKAGRLIEAQTRIKEALRLNTRDARLFYHAGMIARAAGDRSAARDYFRRSLALSPSFDPLQATIARKALED